MHTRIPKINVMIFFDP